VRDTQRASTPAANQGPEPAIDGSDEATSVLRLQQQVATLTAENEQLRQLVAQLQAQLNA